MSKVIFLNGCSSSGKTSIVRSIQHLSDELWLTFGVDTFFDMLPMGKQESYFNFTSGVNEYGPTMRVESGKNTNKLIGVMPEFARILADAENNLIIDEVLLENSSLIKNYAQRLKNHTVYYIGVFCELGIMQEREILRRDRGIGLSNDQIDRVHQGILGSYDFKVDTSHFSPFEASLQVLKYIDNNPEPKAFQEINSQS